MLRTLTASSALLLAGLSLAQAADPQTIQAADTQDLRAKAEKTCNDALDNGNFGNYNSIDECVDDTVHKMMQAQKSGAAASRPN